MPEFNIRPATMADVAAIARVHINSWRTSYQGIVAQETLAGLSVERRQQLWQEYFRNPQPGTCLFVAESRDAIVGFISAGPARQQDDPALGEVYAIYLLQAAQGNGLGRSLMQAACSHLLAQGRSAIMLWVLKDNLKARKFYEALGGKYYRQQTIEIGGQTLIEVAYQWHDIHTLFKE